MNQRRFFAGMDFRLADFADVFEVARRAGFDLPCFAGGFGRVVLLKVRLSCSHADRLRAKIASIVFTTFLKSRPPARGIIIHAITIA